MVKNSGVTFIEMLIVIAIIAVISGAASPLFTNSLERNNQSNTIDMAKSAIRKAQNYSMSGKNNSVWGICLASNNLRIFTGTCNSPTLSEDFTLPGSVTLTGLSSTTFSKSRGEPSAPIDFTVSNNLDSTQIQVNSSGGLTIN